MPDIQTEADIKLLVDSFYQKVKNDDLLGPIFLEKLGQHWDNHLETMYKFWGMALLGDSRYTGHPLSKHLTLPVEEAHFNRWLHLFFETLGQHFDGPVAGEAMKKAGLIARTFLARISSYQGGQATP
ncbi:group III truncated hemoglobin [Puia sp.]|jgi:hemoglobin|uniref:group III truncated hemoglobin n=1 Tax=Puia sp. TaxID=2045100 RepID=UPI002F3E806C